MISQTAEYALRAMVHLAGRTDSPFTTQQIAVGTQVPLGYLSKVMQLLGRAGLVGSQRGLHGGFTLTRSPESIRLLDVVNAVEPIQRIRQCPLGRPEHGTRLCPLHRQLDQAAAMVERAFSESTLADLLNDNRSGVPHSRTATETVTCCSHVNKEACHELHDSHDVADQCRHDAARRAAAVSPSPGGA